ncbi:hypothetical protein HPB47_024184 [Ixodes persulcatus]|uniref:Uncharacterized protein n=1 Tax=Ixodes persulcatus TaxID=34615 RepID=A0AC60Q4Y0_IXOPE|nr:hypothetical protein HPB47_024184 [Ixodes persulcatus]
MTIEPWEYRRSEPPNDHVGGGTTGSQQPFQTSGKPARSPLGRWDAAPRSCGGLRQVDRGRGDSDRSNVMADPGRSLGVNLFVCCLLVLCAGLVFVVPLLGQLWQVIPELSTVEVAMRFQGLFLAMAAVCGMAAYCRRAGSSRLHALVGSCAACSAVAVCLTAVLFAYKLLLLLQVLERDDIADVIEESSRAECRHQHIDRKIRAEPLLQ